MQLLCLALYSKLRGEKSFCCCWERLDFCNLPKNLPWNNFKCFLSAKLLLDLILVRFFRLMFYFHAKKLSWIYHSNFSFEKSKQFENGLITSTASYQKGKIYWYKCFLLNISDYRGYFFCVQRSPVRHFFVFH